MAAFAASPKCRGVARIWSSPERKARDGAEIAAQALGLDVAIEADLAEIDRSAVGFTPEPGFGRLRERFFAFPDASPDGWERAADAQTRILAAIRRIAQAGGGCPLVVSHGAVGTLALCALSRRPIAPEADQPRQGCWFRIDAAEWRAEGGWRAMPDAAPS